MGVCEVVCDFVFFFKQKTAYEMRISDWSSDVCSSDLAEKREVLPDPKFGDVVLSKFMNCLMYDGKKSIAEGIVYGWPDRVRERGAKDPVRVFPDALDNVKPELEVRRRRGGGATSQVPVDARHDPWPALPHLHPINSAPFPS